MYSNLEKLAYQRQLIGAGIGAVTGGGAGYLGSSRGAHEDEESFGRRRLGNTLIGGALGGALGGGIGHMTRAKPAASKPASSVAATDALAAPAAAPPAPQVIATAPPAPQVIATAAPAPQVIATDAAPAPSPRLEQSAVVHEAPRPPQGGGSTPAAKPTGAPKHQYYIGDVHSRYTADERVDLERILRRAKLGTATEEDQRRLRHLLNQGNAKLFRTRSGYLVVARDYVHPKLDPAKIVPHWEAPKMNKTSAWRDLPHLARGVLSNLREHTLPEIKHIADMRKALHADPDYINSAQTLRERAGRVADVLKETPLGDARQNEAVARLLRMYRTAGRNDVRGALYDIYSDRAQQAERILADPRATAGQLARAYARRDRAVNVFGAHDAIRGTVLDADMSNLQRLARVGDQSGSLYGAFEGARRGSALRAARPVDAGFMQSIGAKPVPQLIGKHIEPVVESPHYMMHGLKPVVIGTPGPKVPYGLHHGAGGQLPLIAGVAVAPSQDVLAHELGHATGIGTLVTQPLYSFANATNSPVLKLPEEVRAQMRAQDIMRDWQRRGAASGLPAELAHLTPEQLKEHTIPLSTYADAAARSVANTALDARDKVNSARARLERLLNKEKQ